MTGDYDTLVQQLRAANVGQEAAEREAARRYPDAALGVHAGPTLAQEKAVEHAGDKIMLAHGFTVIRLSQPRASKITPGLPDRRYYRAPRVAERRDGRFVDAIQGYAAWWEAKTETGVQSPAQKAFQELVEACGETYLLGTDAVLRSWLMRMGLHRD